MNQPSVLLVSEDPEFARALMMRWQSERVLPGFVVMAGETAHTPMAAFDVAVVGPCRAVRLEAMLAGLEPAGRTLLHLYRDEQQIAAARQRYPQLVCLRQQGDWAEVVVLLVREMLRRVEAVARARRAEQAAETNQREAALGRYLTQMRHGFNNSLTSVLGNAELILLEPHSVAPGIRDQIQTIHSMSLRMHEIMQRLASLESELQLAEGAPRREVAPAASH